MATAVGALLVIALVLWPGTTSEAEFAREGQEAVPESMTLEPRDRVDLEAAIRTAITCVEAGEIPASPEDAEIYDGMDYDDLVSLGVFTREEAKLQRELDTAFIARSTQLDSTKERRKEDDR